MKTRLRRLLELMKGEKPKDEQEEEDLMKFKVRLKVPPFGCDLQLLHSLEEMGGPMANLERDVLSVAKAESQSKGSSFCTPPSRSSMWQRFGLLVTAVLVMVWVGAIGWMIGLRTQSDTQDRRHLEREETEVQFLHAELARRQDELDRLRVQLNQPPKLALNVNSTNRPVNWSVMWKNNVNPKDSSENNLRRIRGLSPPDLQSAIAKLEAEGFDAAAILKWVETKWNPNQP